jgi:hypothetical protein
MTKFEFAILFTVVGVPVLAVAAKKASKNLAEISAAGIGAGLGIAWRKGLGFDDISYAYDIGFLAVAIAAAYTFVRVLRREE